MSEGNLQASPGNKALPSSQSPSFDLDDIPWHFLRQNEGSRYPRRIICLDSEARIERAGNDEVHLFRLAAASFDRLLKGQDEPAKSERTLDFEPEGLWQWITARCTKKERTVLFAQNLGYDLRLTQALRILPSLGWSVKFASLDSNRCILRWEHETRILLMTDSLSWLPKNLEAIGGLIGVRKPPLPSQEADEGAWAARCTSDVEILRAAMLDVLHWLEHNDMGNWRMTGAAQAQAAYRHRFMPGRMLLVHRDEEALAAERRAAWTGRCEAWRHGKQKGPLYELDFELCYLRLAQSERLPVRLISTTGPMSLRKLSSLRGLRRVLCECSVSVLPPLLPTSIDGRMTWPSGQFNTTIWDSEVHLAIENGGSVSIERAWIYVGNTCLKAWADWLLDQLTKPTKETSDVVRLMLKSWARSLIGRFGLRYAGWEHSHTLDEASIQWTPYVDTDSGETGSYVQIGQDVFERGGQHETRDSMPAIMSAIMAAARVQLWQAIEAAGPGNVLYVDTDSLLVNAAGRKALLAPGSPFVAMGLRQKARYSSATISAPRHLKVDGEVRAAGLPRSAMLTGDDTYSAEVWESLTASMRRNTAEHVNVRNRTFKLRAGDRRRRHLPDGSTEPYAVETL